METSFYSLPVSQDISQVCSGNPTLIITQKPHQFTDDLYVRLFLPYATNSSQLDRQIFTIKVVAHNAFYIPKDTTGQIITISKLNDSQAIPVGRFSGNKIMVSMQNQNFLQNR